MELVGSLVSNRSGNGPYSGITSYRFSCRSSRGRHSAEAMATSPVAAEAASPSRLAVVAVPLSRVVADAVPTSPVVAEAALPSRLAVVPEALLRVTKLTSGVPAEVTSPLRVSGGRRRLQVWQRRRLQSLRGLRCRGRRRGWYVLIYARCGVGRGLRDFRGRG
jgi:hypothetical protein